jgi:uncharacterized protein YqcC (DUF446 family)
MGRSTDLLSTMLDLQGYMSTIAEKVREIETEMQRIGFWSSAPAAEPDSAQLYSGLPFEHWLQFVYLPAVKMAAAFGQFSSVPPYPVGLAALRQYDYHSTVEEALPLVDLCNELERLLSLELEKAQQNTPVDVDKRRG